MSEKVAYVVTDGEYSDYRIVAVFLDKAQAEKYAENYNKIYNKRSGSTYSDGAEVEEHKVRNRADGVAPHLWLRFEKDPAYGEPMHEREGFVWESEARPITCAASGRNPWGGFVVHVKGCDFTAVRKAFSERVVKAEAESGTSQ